MIRPIMTINAPFPLVRSRRLRRHPFLRDLVQESSLCPQDLIMPLFIQEGHGDTVAIPSMPGIYRYSLDTVLEVAQECSDAGIPAILLFPAISKEHKSLGAEEAYNPDGLVQRAIRMLKKHLPHLGVITDVALDPYTVHGQDGLMDDSGYILNDATVEVLVKQAVSHAKSGADIIAPSDMMDGRIGAIRQALENEGFPDISLLAYSAKYASHFYGPFRDAVNSKDSLGGADKKSYQMDPANTDEALREAALDLQEGADIIMIKPGLPYLDVLWRVKQAFGAPTFAYQVSGEYAMLRSAIDQGWLAPSCVMESLLCFKRAGADAIVSYFALEVAKTINDMMKGK